MITDRDIEKLKTVFATKEDLKQFATKDDLKRFATKEDLNRFVTKLELREELKEWSNEIISTIEKVFNDHAQRTDSRIEKLEREVSIIDMKMNMSLSKISELSASMPSIVDHELRIWQLEQR